MGEVEVQICISGLWGVLIIIFMFLSIHLSFILIFVVFMEEPFLPFLVALAVEFLGRTLGLAEGKKS